MNTYGTPGSVAKRRVFSGLTSPALERERDQVAVLALVVGMVLQWTSVARGVDQPLVVMATVMGLLGIAIPYLARRGTVTFSASQAFTLRVWLLVPLLAICIEHLVLDAIPGGAYGLGAGMGLALAGALLAIWPQWPNATAVAGVLMTAATVWAFIYTFRTHGFGWGEFATSLISTAFLVFLLWVTIGAFAAGETPGIADQDASDAAGFLLVGLGAVVAVSVLFFGASSAHPWFEAMSGSRFGLLLLPAVAACAAPAVVRRRLAALSRDVPAARAELDSDDWPPTARVWIATARRAFLVLIGLGGYFTLLGITVWISQELTGRVAALIILGLVTIALAALGARTLGAESLAAYRDEGGSAMYGATIVGSAVLVAALLIAVGTEAAVLSRQLTQAPETIGWAGSFGLSAIAIVALLLPRSMQPYRPLRVSLRALGFQVKRDAQTLRSKAEGSSRGKLGAALSARLPGNSSSETDSAVVIGDESDPDAASTRAARGGPKKPRAPKIRKEELAPDSDPIVAVGVVHGDPAPATQVVAAPLAVAPPDPFEPGPGSAENEILFEPVEAIVSQANATVPENPEPSARWTGPTSLAGAHSGALAQRSGQGELRGAGTQRGGSAHRSLAPSLALDVVADISGELVDRTLTGPRWTPKQASDPDTPLVELQQIAREAPHLRPQVAANPSCYPGLLTWLANLGDPDVDAAIERRSLA